MMEELHTPYTVALFFAYFIWYAVPSWLAVFWRLVFRSFTRIELLVFVSFLSLVVTEILLLVADTAGRMQVWGVCRYFSSFAPLLWLWGGWVVVRCWSFSNRKIRWVLRVGVVALALFVFVNEDCLFFARQCRESDGVDALAAADKVSALVKRDYAGPSRSAFFPRSTDEYFTDRRPVVFGNFGALAWAVRGQSEGANLGVFKEEPDYLFLNLDRGGYRSRRALDPNGFELMAKVAGRTCHWALFRNKATPHH